MTRCLPVAEVLGSDVDQTKSLADGCPVQRAAEWEGGRFERETACRRGKNGAGKARRSIAMFVGKESICR